jgi:hypothetical protein
LCFGKVPATTVVVQSDNIPCPKCGKTLEVSMPSRLLGSLAGLLGGWLVFRLTSHGDGILAWVLPIVYAFLAYAVLSPLFLMLTADLVVRPEQPYGEAVAAASGHGSAAHH